MNSINELIEKGKKYIGENNYSQAEKVFLDVLKESPGNAPAHFELGKIYYHQDKHPQAVFEITKALSMDPVNYHAYVLLAKIYRHAQNYGEALKAYENALRYGCHDEKIEAEYKEIQANVRKELAGRKRGQFDIVTKGFRNDIQPYRACATWLITNECNYRCTYCLDSHENTAGFKILTPKEWFLVWKRIYDLYGTMAVQVTGGEPAAYPRFFEIIQELSKMHNFDIQSNLFCDPKEIIGKIPPEYIYRIGGSFHSEHAEFGAFLKKTIMLRDAGYNVEINYVAYPPNLKRLKEYSETAAENDIRFSVLSFQGEHKGRRYPEGYTDAERAVLRTFNVLAGESTSAMEQWDIKHKTIEDRKEGPVAQRKCRMGQMYTWIKSNGDAMRCCKTKTELGNIIAGTFSLLDDPTACGIENCMCWRNMSLGEEDRWEGRWPGAGRENKK